MRGIWIGLSLTLVAIPASAKDCAKMIGHPVHIAGKIISAPAKREKEPRYMVSADADCDATASVVIARGKSCRAGQQMTADGTIVGGGDDQMGMALIQATSYSCQ